MKKSPVDDEDSQSLVLAFGVKVVQMMNIPHTVSSAIKPLALPKWGLA